MPKKEALVIVKPKRMFFLDARGNIKPVHVFDSIPEAVRFKTAREGVEGHILYDDRIIAVRSSYTPRRGERPWLHVFKRPVKTKNYGVVRELANYSSPSTRVELTRDLIKKARRDLRTAILDGKASEKHARTKLAAAMRIVKAAQK
jgi:hypothetical protein